jgi:GT2 family glycosyltransferase
VPDLPSVAVIIVSYNVGDELEACLGALRDEARGLTAAVTVVDNGSTDGTVAMLRERWPAVHVIEAGVNLGFARANNVGVRATASEFVLLLNPDTVTKPGALRILVETLRDRDDAAAAGPRLVDAGGSPELSFGWPASPLGALGQKLILTAYRRNFPLAVRWVERRTREAGSRYWVSGACLMLRRTDLQEVGLLDERFFMYLEDVDLCLSLRTRGRLVLFVPAAEVCHLRGRSASSNPELERRRRQSQMAYYRKRHPAWAPVLQWYLRLRGRDWGD